MLYLYTFINNNNNKIHGTVMHGLKKVTHSEQIFFRLLQSFVSGD